MDSTLPIDSGNALSDKAGIIASLACAVHCAAMPMVLGYLPMLGLSWLADESFHRVMAFVCFGLAVAAFVPGWRRHGSLAPAGVGAVGLAILAFAAFALEGQCCPTCVTEEATTTPVAMASAAATCSDEQCAHCLAAEAESAPATASEPPSEGLIAGWAIPFVTPLGGGLLVAGHLINRQKSCQCTGDSCCLPSADGIEA